MQWVILAAVFLGTAGLVVGAYLFANRRRLAEADLVRSRLGGGGATVGEYDILRDEAASALPFLDRLLRDRGITDAVRVQLERAAVSQLPSVFLLVVATLAVLGAVFGSSYGWMVAVAGAAVGGAVPWVWLAYRKRKRLAAFEAQFPDGLDMIANAMRAGYSFQAATHFLSEEVPAPLGVEFGRFYDQQRLGIDVRTALLTMQDRVPSLNLKMFVTAVLIQRESGGNLTELLTNLATIMRERVALQGHIDTLTAEPKLSARFLVALPVAMFFGFGMLSEGFMAPMTKTSAGHAMIACGIVSVAIGYVVLMKIADIDI